MHHSPSQEPLISFLLLFSLPVGFGIKGGKVIRGRASTSESVSRLLVDFSGGGTMFMVANGSLVMGE
jgi:hypothetical protein